MGYSRHPLLVSQVQAKAIVTEINIVHGTLRKQLQDYLGIFPNRVFPIPKTFVIQKKTKMSMKSPFYLESPFLSGSVLSINLLQIIVHTEKMLNFDIVYDRSGELGQEAQ